MKVLIADGSGINRAILSALVSQLGHKPILAENGVQALEIFERELPDLVLMDLMMPIEDGIIAIKSIKALPAGELTPIFIVATALDSDEDIIRVLEAGANDYFTMPIKVHVVRTKIMHIEQVINARRQIAHKNAELEQYYFAGEEEKRLTSHIMQRLTEPSKLKDPALQYWIKSADYCSGDLLAATRTPGGGLYLLLADGTGHGLSAALDVVSLPQIFYAMASIGHPIGSIAAEMNSKTKSLLPTGHFVASTLIAINPTEKTAEIWNGGNPPTYIVNAEGVLMHSAISRHLPIGVVEEDAFDDSTETIRLSSGWQLLTFSDGLPDAGNNQGEEFGLERILASCLASTPENRLVTLQTKVTAYIGDAKAHDDISILLFEADQLLNQTPAIHTMHHPAAYNAGKGWHMALRLGCDEIQHLDLIPFTIDLLKKLRVSGSHLSSLFLILAELINNAIDHGLLQLDSKLKNDMHGFDAYLDEREDRLSNLSQHATLEITFDLESLEQGLQLLICIKDSGNGFDHERVCATISDDLYKHGRGIGLVQKIAQKLEYKGKGNEVLVTFAF
ncbi:MAG: fused response regulator/phosphatase [Methylophilales bacterium]|nr:fused response regulator/phosphatase [Methylophilales bacterium]